MDILLEVLKWAALVFVAGMIGQLGKTVTLKTLERRRRSRDQGAAPRPAEAPTDAAAAKAAKKAIKAQVKARKKAPAEEPDSE